MLEQMGWSKGKGLGANEDGQIEHVKVSFKSDARGVGCSKSYADKWIAHQDDFDDLLANLNQGHAAECDNSSRDKVISLEKKSKSSRSRVHYRKFTKGKDLSSRSSEDLNCIFGKRKSKKTPEPTSSSSGSNESSDTEKTIDHGVKTITSTSSVQEYFAKKMDDLKRQREGGGKPCNSNSHSDVPDRSGSENNESDHVSGSRDDDNISGVTDGSGDRKFVETNSVIEVEESSVRKKKKSKKSKNKSIEELESVTTLDENNSDLSKKASKKKKKSKSIEEAEVVPPQVENVSEFDEKPIKKKKNKKNYLSDCYILMEGENGVSLKKNEKIKQRELEERETIEMKDETEISSRKKCKKRKKTDQDIDEAESSQDETEISSRKKCKKRKKTDQDIDEAESSQNNSEKSDTKRKKKKKVECEIVDQTEEKVDYNVAEVEHEIRSSKKKKRKKSEHEMTADVETEKREDSRSFLQSSEIKTENPQKKGKEEKKVKSNAADSEKSSQAEAVNSTSQSQVNESAKNDGEIHKTFKRLSDSCREFIGANIDSIVGYGSPAMLTAKNNKRK